MSSDEAAKFIEGEIFFFDLSLPYAAEVDGNDSKCHGGSWKKEMIQRFEMEEESIFVVPRPVPAPRTIFLPIPMPRSAPSLGTEVADCSTPAVLPSLRISLPVPAPTAVSGMSTSLIPEAAVQNKAAVAAGMNPTPAVMSFTSQHR